MFANKNKLNVFMANNIRIYDLYTRTCKFKFFNNNYKRFSCFIIFTVFPTFFCFSEFLLILVWIKHFLIDYRYMKCILETLTKIVPDLWDTILHWNMQSWDFATIILNVFLTALFLLFFQLVLLFWIFINSSTNKNVFKKSITNI